MNRRAHVLPGLTALAFVCCGGSAAAQSSVFVTGSAVAEFKQFDDVASDSRILDVGVAPSNGTGAGGGIRVGTFLHPKWSLELGVDAGSRTKKVYPDVFPANVGFGLRIPEISTSARFLSVNTMVGFHPPKKGRVQLGYRGGFSFVRATHTTELPDFVALFELGEVGFGSATADFSFPSSGIVPTIFPPLPMTTMRISRIDNSPGVILGFEAAIDATSRLAVVPEIRALTFSSGGATVFLIRPGVGVRWSF